MKKNNLFLSVAFWFFGLVFCLLVPGIIHASQAQFSWLPNSETDLAGYKIHYGSKSREYTALKDCKLPATKDGRVFCTIAPCPNENTFYAVIAYDKKGNESDYSNEIEFDAPPGIVQGVEIEIVVKVRVVQ